MSVTGSSHLNDDSRDLGDLLHHVGELLEHAARELHRTMDSTRWKDGRLRAKVFRRVLNLAPHC